MPASPPASPRPAATVVVLRPAASSPFEILMVRRHDQVAFMAGAYVFPGGRLDEADHATVDGEARIDAPHFPDLSVDQEMAYRRAAAREVAEEASVTLAPASLVALAHWVTPEIEIRRYDTRFFLAVVPEGQVARHDERETTALEWLSPAQAIDDYRADRIQLPPPTWTTIRQLARHASIDAVLAWARARRIVRVMPGFFKSDEQTLLTLPGDALHPHPVEEGWETPSETRFELVEGRWRPKG